MARVRFMRVTAQWYLEMCKGGTNVSQRSRIVAHALPADTKLIAIAPNNQGQCVLFIESASFEDLPDDAPMPEQPTTQFELLRFTEPAPVIDISTKH